ncbi:BH3 interacting domain death agonist [Anguilla anguilla]|uniref:BH3 interacting domain death agonist n=1 Tax=Anguilla anguilla TaxID=7936 RepID=UPI0015B26ECE|nr:BH3 interacting domain death agonist [Anguilla anguilla]XP_035280318.1 BH3 interacting domain death agonist [Anguilla anguilla]
MEPGGVELDRITPLVFLSFLQQDCKNEELTKQLDTLGQELKLDWRDINCNGFDQDAEEDGELQTDGHFCCKPRDLVAHLEPSVEVARQVNPANEAVLRNVAAELIEIADQMENRVVSRAADNLMRKLQSSPPQDWKRHLSAEVQSVLGQGLGSGLEQLPQERVVLALTMMLVKGVCERVPRLLQGLFSTALQYMGSALSR